MAGCSHASPWLVPLSEADAIGSSSQHILDDSELAPDSLNQLRRVAAGFVDLAQRLGPAAAGTFPHQLTNAMSTPAARDDADNGAARTAWLAAGGGPRVEDPSVREQQRRIREATLASGRVPTGNVLEKLLGRKLRVGTYDGSSISSRSSDTASVEFTAEVAANAHAVAASCSNPSAAPRGYVPPAFRDPRSPPSDGASPQAGAGNSAALPSQALAGIVFDESLMGGGFSANFSDMSGGLTGFLNQDALSTQLPPTPRSGGLSSRFAAPVRTCCTAFDGTLALLGSPL